jgi:hypothetical protein
MNKKERFFINTECSCGDSYYNAYPQAMEYATQLKEKDFDIKRIVLYIRSKTQPLAQEAIKQLDNYSFKFEVETIKTYKDIIYVNPSDIVICCGMDADDIFEIDDYHNVKYIIAIPFTIVNIKQWINRWDGDVKEI